MPRRICNGIDSLARHPVLAFVIIFLLSVAVRTGILLTTSEAQIAGFAETDRIALSLAKHGTFSDPYVLPTGYTSHSAPFYPLLVSLLYRCFGAGLAGGYARCAATILAWSVLFGLQPQVARRLGFPATAGVLAGLSSAVVPLNRSAEVFWGGEEPYSAIALSFLLVYTLALYKRGGAPWLWALYGFSWGLALHVAPSLLPVELGLCLVHLILFSPGGRFANARSWMLAFAATGLVLLPWTIRNQVRLGAWMYMRSNLGLELHIANQDGSSPSGEKNYASGLSGRVSPYINRDAALWVRANGEAAYNRLLVRRAVAWIQEHPRRFLILTGERALCFWFGPFEHLLFAILTSVTTVLGFCGMRLIKRQAGDAHFWLVLTTLAVYPPAYYLVQFMIRYRAPIRWILLLLACWVVYDWLRSLSCAARPHMPTEVPPA